MENLSKVPIGSNMTCLRITGRLGKTQGNESGVEKQMKRRTKTERDKGFQRLSR